MKQVLVTGGAGYIGSHTAKLLSDHGWKVIILDNLSNGCRDAVLNNELIVGDLANTTLLNSLFQEYHFDAVLHFAASIDVFESTQHPDRYYFNNFVNTLNLLNIMRSHNVKTIIFSSTAAVYGNPETIPILESQRTSPINTYGTSKRQAEQALKDYDNAYGIKSIALRYFNAAGADPDGLIGPRHKHPTHLIPVILKAAQSETPIVDVFGEDYPTPDGTCIRDYIHVTDLATAHLAALEKVLTDRKTNTYNLGKGAGHSVFEVLEAAKEATKRPIRANIQPRREGDPAKLVADATKVRTELAWIPKYPDLQSIINHAWAWEQTLTKKH